MNYVGIDWAYGRAAFCAMSEAGAIESEGLIPAGPGRPREAGPQSRHRGQGVRRDDERRGLGSRPVRALRLGGPGRPRAQGQGHRPARLQDRQGRRPGPGRASPARPGPGALDPIALRPGPARAAATTGASGQGTHPPSQPDSRPPDPIRPADLAAATARTARSSCSPAAACPRSGASRSPSTSPRSIIWTGGWLPIDKELGPIACSDPRARLLQTIPGFGPLLGLTFHLGDRRGLALLVGLEAGRLRRPRPADQPVG